MSKTVRYTKTTRARLIELLERIGWSVRRASTDGTFRRIHDVNNKFTGYWIIGDYECRIEHRIEDFQGGLSFYLKDCIFELMDGETVCIVGKNDKSLFISFHNFHLKSGAKTKKEQSGGTHKNQAG